MQASRKATLALLATLAAAPLPAAWVAATPARASDTAQALQSVLDGPQRTPAFKLRDKYRHPLQTLEFFGIRADMTVVEVLPGGGWYTEILAPFLRAKGRLIEATPPESSPNPFFRKAATAFSKKLASDPAVYGSTSLTPFEPPDYMPMGAPDSADMVMTFLNMHDFVYANVHKEVSNDVVQKFLRSAWQVLKAGGALGIVAHRARAGENVSASMALGRVPQDYVIKQAELAGFRLAGASEANANPKDDGARPVWNLPPTLSLGEQDRAKYLAIGESDNMTLRFIAAKP